MEKLVTKTFNSGEGARKVKVRPAVGKAEYRGPVAGDAQRQRTKPTKAEKRLQVRRLDYERNNLGGKVGKGGSPAYHRPGSMK